MKDSNRSELSLFTNFSFFLYKIGAAAIPQESKAANKHLIPLKGDQKRMHKLGDQAKTQ